MFLISIITLKKLIKNILNKYAKKKKTLIIAEACDNHFGKLSNAKDMVIMAKKAGADVVKFQHHLADERCLKMSLNRQIFACLYTSSSRSIPLN